MTRPLASPARFILPLLLVAMAGVAVRGGNPPRSTGTIALERIAIGALRVNPNLLSNAGFEETPAGSAIPTGWIWDQRNTDATCRSVADGAAATACAACT